MNTVRLPIDAFFDNFDDWSVNLTVDPLTIDNANRVVFQDVDSQTQLVAFDESNFVNGHTLIIELDRDNKTELSAAIALVLKTKGECNFQDGGDKK